MAHASIEEFVCRYSSLQQTALIDNLLYEDKQMDMYNGLYNLHVHKVELSTGAFTGTHQQLMAKKATIIKQLGQEGNPGLANDIELIETSRGDERTVYEWYPIPYWVARVFIDEDEVVLSWKDCYWWGRCTVAEPLTTNAAIVSLFSMLDGNTISQ